MRTTLTAAIITVLARCHGGKSSNVEIKERHDPQDDDCYAAECYSDSQKPAPHSMTRRQYKTLVLPRRSRKSKRR